tara:strand:- start:775 stop:1341 length:567 start_codon:yes stop_codon:yes gene_type:complete
MIVDQIPEDGKIVEIGSFLGRSTHYLATSLFNANKLNVTIYCVDTFQGSSEHVNLKLPQDFSQIFRDNLEYYINRDMVIPMQGRSDDTKILEVFEEASIDYIMVDGAHEYEPVIDDIQNWWPKLKPNGVMFGDDYQLASVSEAVKKTLPAVMAGGLGVNGSQEQTWYASKDDTYTFFEKAVPGVNCLK